MTPPALRELARCAATFLPADPPRHGRVAFWCPDGSPPTTGGARAEERHPGLEADPYLDESGNGDRPENHFEQLTVVLPAADSDDAGVTERQLPALLLPVAEALPVLTRARGASGSGSAAFWGAAALLALQLAARGRLLPGLTVTDQDAWRLGPLEAADFARVRELAAAMPPYARAVPLPGPPALRLPEPTHLLRAFLDAVADGLPRTPAAALAAGGPAFAAQAPRRLTEQRPWAESVAAGQDAGVRLSLRIEVGLPVGGESAADPERSGAGPHPATRPGPAGRFRAVLQLHSLTDPTRMLDAAELWAAPASGVPGFGPRARAEVLLALRRAAAGWEPLTPLLTAAVPDAVELADEEAGELLGVRVSRELAAAGVQVHWPRELVRELTAQAVVGPPQEAGPQSGPGDGGGPSLLGSGALLGLGWHFAVDGQRLSRAELNQLAEASRPLVRLHDRWVLVDPQAVRQARDRRDRKVTAVEALSAALTGATEEGTEVVATGWLAALRERLADPTQPDSARAPVGQPAALRATLRDYQLQGLDWLHRMTSLGLGVCLADDMGLGKTITLIALHLHRGEAASEAAGPTLVVCPASLLGNWQREIERFAPGTPVRRYHGAARDLDELADGEFVLTTYGTLRRDAGRLASAVPKDGWGLVVADEAQHVKNPYAATARALRTLPARARIALTGTPVENNLSELWAILDWVTPGLLGTLSAFRRRYAQAVESGEDPAAAARLARLVRPFLLRRRKSDPGIAPELPPKTETDHPVSLTVEQAGLYEAAVREGLDAVAEADGLARRGLVVKLLTALKQICNHPAQYLKEDGSQLAGRSGKLELLDELLDTLLAEGSSVLVFTQYVQLARLLERHLTARGVPLQLLHGGTPVARREELVQRFQEGDVPVFLLSLKAAGTGLNLTRADHVVHFDRWWNPAVEAQATDRAHRIGQLRPVQVHRLIAEGTIEERIAALLARKQELADAVLRTGQTALTELTDTELADLVALRSAP